ncbi:MAG: DUF4301 family protein [Bacteroidales bacterium]|nr:DUF4301 family protein [Bacteroidales bacterium]
MFTQKDLQQIRSKGISIDDINQQIKHFQHGFPPADITMPATPGKGVMLLTEGDQEHFKNIYLDNAPDNRIIRFVPASGAASRMFKSLFNALEKLEGKELTEQQEWIANKKDIKRFFKKLESYPFYEDLSQQEEVEPVRILLQLLGREGLHYGNKPKGLLKFHKYSETDRRTAFEEHIREAVKYCGSRDGMVRMHLTVSSDHLDGFQTEAARILPKIERETEVTIDLSFSFQKPETDTIAVDSENEPFRNPDGRLLFRPGGHGALIRNLDALDGDIVFISNIDNVAPDRLKNLRVKQKQVLGGVLLEIRSKIFYYLQQLSGDEKPEKTRLDSMVTYLHERLGIAIPEMLDSWDVNELKKWLIATMNRPIRVCGMVRNEGEPGGGPLYVRSESGEVTLQIVESSQIDMEDQKKAQLVQGSTHFNPVDLVCSLRDYRGEKFNLTRFVDHNTGFISEKSVGGRSLKALELPGLWNGSMAGWLTLFVDVPVETFTPVKTIFDLGRKEHRV